MLEVLKVPMVKEEEKGDEIELSLELSIGGGRYEKNQRIQGSDFENGCESVDLQRKREIQALRRQEARKKREEKLKKSRKVGFVEDKIYLEAQKFQARVEDRGIREKDAFLEETGRKKDKNSPTEVANNDLNLSLFTENKIPSQQIERDYLLHPKVRYIAPRNYGFACSSGVPSWVHNVGEGKKNEGNVFGAVAYRNGSLSMDCDSEHSNGNGINERGNWKAVPNRSLEQSSSAVSDYQSTSHKGGSSSDTGSHSSPFRPRHYRCISRNAFDHHPENNNSSTQPDQSLRGMPERSTKVAASFSNPHSSWSVFSNKPKPDTCFDRTNNACSTSNNPASPPLKETHGDGLSDKPIEPPTQGLNSVSRMPCVSTTGNGPNGKTITGFLYKYTKTEVSIICVCHRSLFSPAGFVEHAGGVDISHPLRHITIVPSAFG
ncbi:hypothetical protein DH2020_021942 [Rehmannia glutinosa]|uniref:Ninja-family protein n=1 Tax=Rehmannia glutinosa TaxID=99300 RepID=A0ABR0WFP6_REHGL